MDKDTLLSVENVSKKFCRTIKHVLTYGALDIAKDFVGISSKSERLRRGEFWALKDISFRLGSGETLGLVGPNGSGKSTLLRLINGIFMPDAGRVTVAGKVGALIAVGAGFHPLLTGKENIYVNGQILGMSKGEIDSKFTAIVDFADIGDFIDAPVKHYSSGMVVRLGFSIAIHCDPELLLVDEVLAVGDYNFQYKCFEKIKEIKRGGTSIILVSHNMSAIQSVCERGIFLNQGGAELVDDINRVLEAYARYNSEKMRQIVFKRSDLQDETGKKVSADTRLRRGTGQARFEAVSFLDRKNQPVHKVPYGTKTLKVSARYFAPERIDKPRFAFYLKDASKGEPTWILGAVMQDHVVDFIEGAGEILFEIDCSQLGPNLYGLYLGITDSEVMDLAYDVWDINGIVIEIEPSQEIVNRGLNLTRPYIIQHNTLSHLRNNTNASPDREPGADG